MEGRNLSSVLSTKFGMAVIAIGCMTLVGCVRGGGGRVPISSVPQLDYSNMAAPHHSYAPYETPSHVHTLLLSDDVREVYIGGDLEPRETLRHFKTTENGIRYFMGASRDGVGVERLKNYDQDLVTQDGADPYGLSRHGFKPFMVQPSLYLDPDLWDPENAGILRSLYDSILILNDALPPEFQIVMRGTRATDIANWGEIMVSLESPASIRSTCGETAVACARDLTPSNRSSSNVRVGPGIGRSGWSRGSIRSNRLSVNFERPKWNLPRVAA